MKNYFVKLIYADGRVVTVFEDTKENTLRDYNAWHSELEPDEQVIWGVHTDDGKQVIRTYDYTDKY